MVRLRSTRFKQYPPGNGQASQPIGQQVSKSDIKFVAGLATAAVALVALVWFIVWMIIDQSSYYDDQQKKQDACLKAGGMWIDNRNTEGYCFFNK